MSGRVIWSCSEKKTHKNPEVSRPMAEDTAILDFRDLHMLCILKNLVICFYKKEPAIKNSKAMPGHEKVKISDLAEEATTIYGDSWRI